MKKKDLIESIKNLKDDDEIFFCTSEYEIDDDMYWSPDYLVSEGVVEFDNPDGEDKGSCYIRLTEVKEFR